VHELSGPVRLRSVQAAVPHRAAVCYHARRTQLKRRLIASCYGKGLITEVELMEKLSGERTAYQALFQRGDGAH